MARVGAQLVAVTCALGACAFRAHAADALSLAAEGCPGDVITDAARIAAVELGRPVEVVASPGPRISVSCAGDEVVLAGGASPARTIGLHGVDPRVHARVLALAIAEYVEAVPPPPAPPPALPAAPPAAAVLRAQVPEARPSRLSTNAGGTLRAFTAGSFALGVRVGLLWSASEHLVASFGLRGEAGALERPQGTVDVRSFAGESLLGLRFGGDRRLFIASAGFAAGAVSARGLPGTRVGVTGGTVVGAWAGPLARLRAQWTIGRNLTVGVETDAAYVPVTIAATTDGRDERVWGGPCVGAAVDVGWSW